MNGLPRRAATSATCGPYVSRFGLRLVPNRGGTNAGTATAAAAFLGLATCASARWRGGSPDHGGGAPGGRHAWSTPSPPRPRWLRHHTRLVGLRRRALL